MTKGTELIALARSKAGQWYYTNDTWARMNPEASGGTDCSGFVRWCYLQFGIDVGTWTGNESYAGYEVARGHYPSEIPWDSLQPGDLILMTATYWNDYSFSHYLCHIELYCGGGTMIGHPGGYGPQEKWAQAWMQAYGCITWMVRRVFEGDDDVSAFDVWGYTNHDMNGNSDAYQLLTDIHRAISNGTSSLMYKNQKMNGDNDVYQMLTDMNKKLNTPNQTAVAAIDYDKLANAVADKLAARMKD